MDSSALSINASIYRYQDATLKVRQTTPVAFTLNHNNQSLLFLPSSFGAALKTKDVALAFSVFQIDRFNVSSLGYVDYTGTRLSAKLELDSVSYLIGPTLGFKLGTAVSAGLSCFYHYSSAEYTFAQALPGNFAQNLLVVTKSSGITGVFGIKAAFNPEWKLGIMYGTETLHLDGETTHSLTNTSVPSSLVNKVDGDVRLPHRTAFGIAYDKVKAFTLAFDVIYYFPLEYSAPYELSATDYTSFASNKHKERAHFDFSLGCEAYVTDVVSLRAGLYTNSSGATKQNGQTKVNHLGGTLGAALVTGDVTTSIGTNIMYGKSGYTQNHPSPLADPASSWKRLFISLVVGSTAKL
jgi:hypothetical protein